MTSIVKRKIKNNYYFYIQYYEKIDGVRYKRNKYGGKTREIALQKLKDFKGLLLPMCINQPKKPKKRITQKEIERAVRLYKSGVSSAKIGKRLNKSDSCILNTLRKLGINTSKRKRSGHKFVRKDGYVQTMIYPESPYYCMGSTFKRGQKERNGRRIQEHRLVMAQHLGRVLESWEVVHHINHDKADNRIENLELVTARINGAEAKLWQEFQKLRKEN